ncbi:hypothetical protein, partial [Desulfovibrio sp.]|uniref:hypothetical protein n=1 Tax=Desulfovibrio sp. TaxID=885 RepID=UPI00260AC097
PCVSPETLGHVWCCPKGAMTSGLLRRRGAQTEPAGLGLLPWPPDPDCSKPYAILHLLTR